MKKVLFLLALLATPFLGKASHIVGGEFELIHLKDFQYRLNMILYFDEINGAQGAKDRLGVDVRIFRLYDNANMMDVHLPFISIDTVHYTQPSCSHGELITTRLLYSADITLSPDAFNHLKGYYISWERCCRNYTITNIWSEDPMRGPNYAGQTFYLEFPPVVKDGQPFVDSTPRLFPPLNDFACPRRPYYTDFGGIDDDNDSLVYSLVTPLSTITNQALPPGGRPEPRPYPEVIWRSPYSLTNILNGLPDLRISRDGFLTVTPTTQGLFVFAVKVEEFRDKVKIGETRRDFQMLVVDACPIAQPPQIVGKKLTDVSYTNAPSLNVFFANTTPDAQRCIKVQVSDPDSQSPDDNLQERITIKAFALNFKKKLTEILPDTVTATLINGSTREFMICFPACPYFLGGDPQIGIIAMDDACSLPLTDTLKVNLNVEPPLNRKPYFVAPPTVPVNSTLNEGTSAAWPFEVRDDDNNPLILSLLTNGFLLANAGMTFNIIHQVDGEADGQLGWDAFCNIYDYTKRTAFQVTIQVEDQDQCLLPDPVKAVYNLNVLLPGNADPVIDTDLTPDSAERHVTGITRRINESLNFTITGSDLTDNDFLVLNGDGKDFTLSDYGLTLSPSPATGNGTVTSDLKWDILCSSIDLQKKDTLNLQFIAVDHANKCRIYKADTLDVQVKVLPPLNQPPQLTVTNKNSTATTLSNNSINMILGPAIDLLLTGTDGDVLPTKDNLKIELVKKTGTVEPAGYNFAMVKGRSPLQDEFTWQPDCSIFQDGVYENEYAFTIRITDDHCITAKKDSVILKFKIRDIDGSDTRFMPPNFFSPNGDEVNDYFAMETKDPVNGELMNILPLDNCVSVFEYVNIYNRWGNTVFQSSDRNFRWYGAGESAGVYFYSIKYSKKEYKGSISLRY